MFEFPAPTFSKKKKEKTDTATAAQHWGRGRGQCQVDSGVTDQPDSLEEQNTQCPCIGMYN